MALTPAERAKRWREKQKSCPEKYDKYLSVERKRYRDKKEKGVVREINELPARDQRAKRKQWRKNQVSKRQRDKRNAEINKMLDENTPPTSPVQNAIVESTKQRGRKKVRRDRAKAYRRIDKLIVKLNKKDTLLAKYRKRVSRMKNSNKESPRTKTEHLLRGQNVSATVKRTLLFHHSLVLGIKEKYHKSKGKKRQQLINNVISSAVLRKYRLRKHASHTFAVSRKRKQQDDIEYHRAIQRNRIRDKMCQHVREFLERDDNSRASAGKKETITRHKIKKQKRFLNDDMLNLHAKYQSEYTDLPISYSLFCKLRPFWIMKPSQAERQTCLCIKHENLQYEADKLKEIKVINTSNLENLASQICCDTNTKGCMYRECNICQDKDVLLNAFDPGQQLAIKKWKTKRVEKLRKNNEGETVSALVSMTVREDEQSSLEHIVNGFQEHLKQTCRHFYNIKHQYRSLQMLKENMTEEEVLIHMDFSENYNCKYDKEIQSVHFGASQTQVTLHTGIVYHKKEVLFPFCSTSDYHKHGPSAIWAHITPILNTIKSLAPSVKTLNFLSDGPTTQYRSKHNFFLLANLPYELGFSAAYWNFLEAGHGKGPADGIGGAVKRTADNWVAKGNSITDASSMMDGLTKSGTTIKLFFVKEEEAQIIQSSIPLDLQTVPETMKIHQVYTGERGTIRHRVLSCYCSHPLLCECFNFKTFTFHMAPQVETETADATNIPNEIADPCLLDNIDESLLGKWCVVSYDNMPYPGIIQNVDDDQVEVQVMARIGENRFFWPRLSDVLWYEKPKIVMLIAEPSPVGSRHFELSKNEWETISVLMDLQK